MQHCFTDLPRAPGEPAPIPDRYADQGTFRALPQGHDAHPPALRTPVLASPPVGVFSPDPASTPLPIPAALSFTPTTAVFRALKFRCALIDSLPSGKRAAQGCARWVGGGASGVARVGAALCCLGWYGGVGWRCHCSMLPMTEPSVNVL